MAAHQDSPATQLNSCAVLRLPSPAVSDTAKRAGIPPSPKESWTLRYQQYRGTMHCITDLALFSTVFVRLGRPRKGLPVSPLFLP